MQPYDIAMIGHVSKDIMIYKSGLTDYFTGGPVVYSSIAAAKTGKTIQVITAAAAEDDSSLDVMRSAGVSVTRLDSSVTTSIKNMYLDEKQERRNVFLLAQADAFSLSSVINIESRIFHMAGLFRNEIPDVFISFLASKGKLGVDAQGLLRCSVDGEMIFKNWEVREELMPSITFLKTDAAEAEILTGTSDREKAAKILAGWGAKEVMVTHNDEVLIYTAGEFFRAPYNPSTLVGRTGRGDTTFASYMAKRLDADPDESVWYSAMLCSIKMETPGPFQGTPDEVYERIRKSGYR